MNLVRLGTHYGGRWIDLDSVTESSIVYSAGIGEDASFDLGLIQLKNCKVHGFDPTPRSIQWVKKNMNSACFIFHEYGLGPADFVENFYPPTNTEWVSHSILPNPKTLPIKVQLRSLVSIMHELNHSHIDLLKMDIEGAEYDVLNSARQILSLIKQICVEFHPAKGIVIADEIAKLTAFGFLLVKHDGEEYTFLRSV